MYFLFVWFVVVKLLEGRVTTNYTNNTNKNWERVIKWVCFQRTDLV